MFTVLLPVLLALTSTALVQSVHASHHDLKKKALETDIAKEAQRISGGKPDDTDVQT